MGVKTDWLFLLIFEEVEQIWKRATREGLGNFGPALASLLISEMTEADWGTMNCCGAARRCWSYSGDKPVPVEPVEAADPRVGQQRGMFYERGIVQFHVAPDRKRVLFSYILGPRFGQGMAFKVHGQGAKGKLIPDEGTVWKS